MVRLHQQLNLPSHPPTVRVVLARSNKLLRVSLKVVCMLKLSVGLCLRLCLYL